METKNAVIVDAGIAIEEYGILSARITLDYGKSTQVLGQALYLTRDRLDGGSYAGFFLYEVLEVIGVSAWEQLKGKAVRVMCDECHVEAIGHVINDSWFYPNKAFDQEVSA
jgi:hypothetical protein